METAARFSDGKAPTERKRTARERKNRAKHLQNGTVAL